MEETKEYSPPGAIESNRIQVPCKRDVSGTKFTSGVQDFDFSIGGNYIWRPSKSYFRCDMTLTAGAGGVTQPVVGDQIAFADNPCAGLYDNVFVRGGGADISSIINYAGQAHQLKTRSTKSRAWRESIGKSAFGINASFNDRVNAVSADGISSAENIGSAPTVLRTTIIVDGLVAVDQASGVATASAGGSFAGALVGDLLVTSSGSYTITVVTSATSVTVDVAGLTADIVAAPGATVVPTNALASGQASERANVVRYMWQPPVGLFDWDSENGLGSGEYRIQLNPSSRYETSIVQTAAALVAGTGYNVVVNDVVFFPWIEKANVPTSGIERLFLNEMMVQSKGYVSNSVLDFTVPPSTQQIAVFVQSNAAGSLSTQPSTLFRTSTGILDSQLANIQITYANKSMPATNWSSSYSGNSNLMTQRYLDTIIETGMIENPGGAESFSDFQSAGGYYLFDFGRSSTDRSTAVQLSLNFTNALPNANVMICAFYNRVVEITSDSGRIVNIQSLSV